MLLSGGVFGMQLDYKGGALMNKRSAFLRRNHSFFAPCDYIVSM